MEQLINFIIRPPRAEYDPKNDLLDLEFMLRGKWYQRKDVEVINSRGDVLQCSHYMPAVRTEGKALPCVIYCHGNSGCRADASEAAIILLPSNITVFTLDFSGSGISGGEHVTLGWNEKDDLRAVVDYLRADGNVSLIGLWGRSMGAVTSLMYGAEDPSIAGMVLDSPFSDLVDLMMELVDTYKVRLPKFTVKFAIQYMRRAILKKAKFDIAELNAIKVAKSCFVPVLFGHAVDDDFIQPHHSDRVYDAYIGDKNIIKFEGDHNSPRPQFYFDSINIFFHNVLQPPEDEVGASYCFGKDTWSSLHDIGYSDEDFLMAPVGPTTSSTEDALNQLRTKRPMSRTEVPSDISSNDKQSEAEVEGSGSKASPSSSDMISFEFSDGHPYGPHVPTTIDDDEYVEYPLGSWSDFPSNAEEEERMFREALMESLKDLGMKQNHVEEQPSGANMDTHAPLQKENSNHNESSTVDHNMSMRSEPAPKENSNHNESSTVDHNMSMRPEPAPKVAANGHNLTTRVLSPDVGASPAAPSPGTPGTAPTLVESGSMEPAAQSSTSTSTKRSSDSDVADCTKATVTVERNPGSNMLDGLMRRLDLSFFRNSR